MRQTSLVAVLLVAIAAPVNSTVAAGDDQPDWVRLSTARDNTFVEFVDNNSLEFQHGWLTAWFIRNFDAPQADAHQPYQSMKGLRMFDCASSRSAALVVTRYAERGAKGGVIDSKTRAPSAALLLRSPPDSVGEEEIEYVCALWQKRRALPATTP